MYAHLHSNTGRHPGALALVARARELDPLSGLINAMEGQFLLHAGRTDEAIARLQEAIEFDPKSRVAHLFAASAYLEKRLYAEALVEAATAYALCPCNTQSVSYESYACAKLGRRDQARDALEKTLLLSRDRYVPPFNIATMYLGLDDPDQALNCLERGFEECDPKMAFLLVEPKWKDLRGNPRFVRLLTRMKLLP
jgi:tetratricopeptide (TPR) repeat protein